MTPSSQELEPPRIPGRFITHMQFPLVEIGARDGVLCLFREAWAFGLAFDFNVGGALDREQFERDLGSLYRVLRYRHIYEVMDDPATMAALREGLINSPQMRDTIALCRGFIHAADVR
ncbi:hypothetical protein AC028_02015 [Xanthomonas citri pv. aurantifolii]|nr:hypothetical protein AC028_02015 [Xanthomonas citri pv. aurantifolii]ARE57857.1 hypothetical protein TP45_17015 [Xanthomonas citri pv. aurantifolii]